MTNKKVKASPDSISYKQWFSPELSPLLSQVNRWLKKNTDIHIWDIVIDGAENWDAEWIATIYYFANDEEST